MNSLIKVLGLEQIGQYKYLESLSGGKAATHCKYKDVTGKIILFKFLIAPRNDSEINSFLNEAEIISNLTDHQTSVIGFPRLEYPLQTDRENGIYYFGFEYIEGKSLRKYIEENPLPWSWERALKLLYYIIESLSSISSFMVVHRDLHPGNIQLKNAFDLNSDFENQQNNIVILDLGCSKNYLKEIYGFENLGRDYFRHFGAMSSWSPEFLRDPQKVDAHTDIWALGVLFFNLLTNQYPIQASNFGEYYENCVTNFKIYWEPISNLNLPYPIEILLKSMLTQDPEHRPLHYFITEFIDRLLRGTLLDRSDDFINWYFSIDGDIWLCPYCHETVKPELNHCPKCKRTVDADTWLPAF